jgi:hypothetical protein
VNRGDLRQLYEEMLADQACWRQTPLPKLRRRLPYHFKRTRQRLPAHLKRPKFCAWCVAPLANGSNVCGPRCRDKWKTVCPAFGSIRSRERWMVARREYVRTWLYLPPE